MPKKKKLPSRRPAAPKSPAHFDWPRHGGYALLAAAVLLVSLFFFLRPSGPRYGQPWKEFSGANALRHVQGLVGLGPRPPESEAIKKARGYIHAQLEAAGWQVIDQPFAAQTPRGTVQFVNVIARRPDQPENEKLFFVGSHYDTKTFDSIQFVGANDGGSSSGALIELGRVLSLHPELAARIELIFFDGEEAYEHFSKTDGLYGSRFFAEKARKANRVQHYAGGIIWDMIGDRDLTITLPPDSPAKLAEEIFAAADALQVRNHFTYYNNDILDDHTPFNEVGIPTIDLIDFDYPPWHTAGDTMDKLSAESLQTVGAVTLYFLAERAFQQ
ncbi:MAG: M28 family peptidase [Chthoniobacterales bacterium]|nr:M28 family peptidase [Chthoniobacterales bacterium]